MCGDNLKLEPMSGELEPNSHQNIKMSLTPARFPTHFEGEIQCSINWEAGDEEKNEIKSAISNHNHQENQEFLFLRLKKRTKFVSTYIYLFDYYLYREKTQTRQNPEKMRLFSKTYSMKLLMIFFYFTKIFKV